MRSFWNNKPVEISTTGISTIHNKEVILKNVDTEIQANKFKLQYDILDGNKLDSNKINKIVEFINKNYVESYDESYTLIYTSELFSFYCKDCIILEFTPLNNETIVGYVIGKKSNVCVFNSQFNTSEVNFLCIVPKLRSLGLASYMINVVSKEIINRYDVVTSHYTISIPIKSPYFGEKTFYHRFLNLQNLQKAKFIEYINTKFTTFNYNKNFGKLCTIQLINGLDENIDLISTLYDNYKSYCKKTYDIYEIVSYEEFKRSFSNKMFYHFIIYNNSNIVGYVCIFRLDTLNVKLNYSIKTGYYYYMFFNENVVDCLEYVNQYIYNQDIFDILTFTDIFDIDYSSINCIKGSSMLRYYYYNFKVPNISNIKNGLITI